MAAKREIGPIRTDIFPSQMKQDNPDVDKIVETTNGMINPFEYEEEELLHIASGTVATEEVEKDLQSAYDRGEAAFIALCKERLQAWKVDLLTSIEKLKLKTFTSMSKTTKSKVHGKEVSLKADRNLLTRLVVIGRVRKVDLQELLSYFLGPVPLALCTPLRCLVKTNKATMLHSLESQLEKAILEMPRGYLCSRCNGNDPEGGCKEASR